MEICEFYLRLMLWFTIFHFRKLTSYWLPNFNMKRIAYLLILISANVATAFQIFDGIDDGVINSELWTSSHENGAVEEINGKWQFQNQETLV